VAPITTEAVEDSSPCKLSGSTIARAEREPRRPVDAFESDADDSPDPPDPLLLNALGLAQRLLVTKCADDGRDPVDRSPADDDRSENSLMRARNAVTSVFSTSRTDRLELALTLALAEYFLALFSFSDGWDRDGSGAWFVFGVSSISSEDRRRPLVCTSVLNSRRQLSSSSCIRAVGIGSGRTS
jgi:hypothetical protein